MRHTVPADAPAPGSATHAGVRYRDNLARHLIGVSRDLQSRVRRSLAEECGYDGLRPSLGPFLSLLWKEARPLKAMALVLGISDQAAWQLANLAEAAGYLERVSHPDDRRSKLLTLTSRGHALASDGARIILEVEAEYEALVGRPSFRGFSGALVDLYRSLDLDPALPTRVRRSVAVLTLMAEHIQRRLMDATIARGHPGLKMSYGQVLPLIGPEGSRVHEISRIQRVSRQAVSVTTRELEKKKYLRSKPDPRDRRGTVLTLTRRGARLIEDGVAALDEVKLDFREALGPARLAKLQDAARELYQALDLEAEVFRARDTVSLAARQASGGAPGRSGRDIDELASRLRHWLGQEDSARLAARLQPGTSRSTA